MMMTIQGWDEFFRLAELAQHDPAAYRMEMNAQRWVELARSSLPIDYEWLHGALVHMFGMSNAEADVVMARVDQLWWPH